MIDTPIILYATKNISIAVGKNGPKPELLLEQFWIKPSHQATWVTRTFLKALASENSSRVIFVSGFLALQCPQASNYTWPETRHINNCTVMVCDRGAVSREQC